MCKFHISGCRLNQLLKLCAHILYANGIYVHIYTHYSYRMYIGCGILCLNVVAYSDCGPRFRTPVTHAIHVQKHLKEIQCKLGIKGNVFGAGRCEIVPFFVIVLPNWSLAKNGLPSPPSTLTTLPSTIGLLLSLHGLFSRFIFRFGLR